MTNFDFYAELQKFTETCPFIYTPYSDFTDSDYLDHFLVKGRCFHTYKMPFSVNPYPLIIDFKDKIVQTYSKPVNNGTSVVNLTIIQLSPQIHLTIIYTEDDNQFAASVAMYTNDAQNIPIIQAQLKPYKFGERQKVVGFGARL